MQIDEINRKMRAASEELRRSRVPSPRILMLRDDLEDLLDWYDSMLCGNSLRYEHSEIKFHGIPVEVFNTQEELEARRFGLLLDHLQDRSLDALRRSPFERLVDEAQSAQVNCPWRSII